MPAMHKNVFILAMCQALAMSGASMVLTATAVAGQILAPEKALVTLPLAAQFLVTMFSTIPASLFMARVGRRIGFTVGQLTGMIGAAISAYALYAGDFWLFVLGGAVLGIHNSFWQYYRFAAADIADEDYRPKAISYVMAGGIAAAFLGPQLAKITYDMSAATYAATYVAIVCLSFLTFGLLQFINIPKPVVSKLSGSGRPIFEIMRTPVFMVAAMSSTIGYGVMNMLMTSTPLAMVFCGFAFNDAATVVQWHIVGMFLPSFFTGHIIKRFGVINVIGAGAVLQSIAVAIALSGIDFANFWFGLVILGLGWNFMFIGGTTLLTGSYAPEERAKTQAAHDFMVFGLVAITAFSSGVLHETLGWVAVNLISIVPISLVFVSVIWYRNYTRNSV